MTLHTDELAKLEAERAKLVLDACGPERTITPSRWTDALTTPTADLAEEASVLFDVATTSGPGGDGPEGIRVRRDAAYLLYHGGQARELERLAAFDGAVYSLVLWELQHAGRPWCGSMHFADRHLPRGLQAPPPPLADVVA